jgi:AcrR family transcriptional regulator
MSLQGGLSIERMCKLAGVSKSGFYRHLRSRDAHDEAMHVRSEIQSIALEHEEHYGYRRVAAELRRRGNARTIFVVMLLVETVRAAVRDVVKQRFVAEESRMLVVGHLGRIVRAR